MKKVNKYFVEALLNPMAGMADFDDTPEYIQKLDANNELQTKEIIKQYLLPEFKIKPEEYKQIVYDSLSYYLTTEKMDFERTFYSVLMPFNAPIKAVTFFIYIWEVFFENKSFVIENPGDYFESDDISEPTRYNLGK